MATRIKSDKRSEEVNGKTVETATRRNQLRSVQERMMVSLMKHHRRELIKRRKSVPMRHDMLVDFLMHIMRLIAH